MNAFPSSIQHLQKRKIELWGSRKFGCLESERGACSFLIQDWSNLPSQANYVHTLWSMAAWTIIRASAVQSGIRIFKERNSLRTYVQSYIL